MEASEKRSAERSFEHVACRYVGECFLVIYQTRKASSFNLHIVSANIGEKAYFPKLRRRFVFK